MGAISIVAIGLLLAFANGGNDQFKGAATLYGSGTATYRRALIWATLTAAFGALGALFYGGGLIAAFSGKGLVPDTVVAMSSFPLSVGLATAGTVLLATRFKLPISTTHALLGSLVGVGWVASPVGLNLSQLTHAFVAPLLLSPVLSALAVLVVYPLFHRVRLRTGITRESCVCVGSEIIPVASLAQGLGAAAARAADGFGVASVALSTEADCRERYLGRFFGVNAGKSVDVLHFMSAGSLCLARAMNDVPKMAALLLIGKSVGTVPAIGAISVSMLAGGWIQSRKIAAALGEDITKMNPGQGFTGNLVTSAIVLGASKLGLPVSTTHVACGSIFGIGAAAGDVRPKIFAKMVSAWVLTLPIAAALGTGCFLLLRSVGA